MTFLMTTRFGGQLVVTTTDVEALYTAERDRFAEDLAGLDDAAWQTPSLCRGWTVRDLCAHLLMPYELGFGSFIVGLAQARFNFDKLADRWARTDRRTGAELTRSIAKTSAAGFAVPGAGELAPLAHLAIHSGDARRPLGLAGRISPEAGWMVLNDLTSGKHSVGDDLLRGLRFQATDADWSRGEGPEVSGDVATLLSALNRRRAAAEDLAGAGADEFRSRLA
ncbi:maleylpyruvate isomerase family mycothiol-dependent enzyme [Cryobacterium psychrotolerans]|uniref:maleylpyruvate isomerase family mycothiol-dependent enzyme n=1 Tax=Cryobacterium psychrotolerans TaxID=386301 RepID=UPI000B8383D5|nr:maleylpyruvate isomerase family mycothiol-dependent enzyme [Cryobacterium psychrotolerans]TFD90734.1 maleylpyruvate isomerase family mycothiol-dependent enzyme [Cryobacterium psychrotolerans]